MPQDANKLYHHGILHLLPYKVEAGLKQGADVNILKELDGGEKHPIRHLRREYCMLYIGGDLSYDQRDPFKYEKIKKENWLQVYDLILAAGPDLTSEKNLLGRCLLDEFVGEYCVQFQRTGDVEEQVVRMILAKGITNEPCSYDKIVEEYCAQDSFERADIAARAVIMTLAKNIKEGARPYEPNYTAIFMMKGSPLGGDKATSIREKLMDAIETVHRRVAERLADPHTQDEVFLYSNQDKISFWVNPFDRPDVDLLPRPSDELLDAVRSWRKSVFKDDENSPSREFALARVRNVVADIGSKAAVREGAKGPRP